MGITLDQLKSLYPRASDAVLKAFVKNAPKVFADFGIDALPVRLEYFLAQIGHESGGLTIFEEKLSYSARRMTEVWPSRFPTIVSATPFEHNPEKLANQVYAGRMGNGPPESGDGFRFRGRGFIQITGRDGYRNVGQRIGVNLESDSDRASGVDDQLLIACGFWKWKALNPLCDARDFKAVTRKINGGLNGLDDRRAWLDKARRVLAMPIVPTKQPDVEVVRSVQLALRARGFGSIGTADGDLGAKTAAAITLFRQRNGMAPGLIDDALLKVLALD
jgi:putative chitinase